MALATRLERRANESPAPAEKPRAHAAFLALRLGEAIRAGESERALALLDELLAFLAD